MVEAMVCWYLRWGIESNTRVSEFGGAKWISQPSTVCRVLVPKRMSQPSQYVELGNVSFRLKRLAARSQVLACRGAVQQRGPDAQADEFGRVVRAGSVGGCDAGAFFCTGVDLLRASFFGIEAKNSLKRLSFG